MKAFTALWRFFVGSSDESSAQRNIETKPDVKFSALIHSIQNDMVAANESMQGIGLKYIEKFFDKPLEPTLNSSVDDQLASIDSLLEQGNTEESQSMLKTLRKELKTQNKIEDNRHYRPKMATFDVPIQVKGKWQYQKFNVPLIALAPIPFPKIKECVFTSRLENLVQKEDELIVSIQKVAEKKRRKASPKYDTELKILISPDQPASELDQVVNHYQQLLGANKSN